jgi:hypothetical protein
MRHMSARANAAECAEIAAALRAFEEYLDALVRALPVTPPPEAQAMVEGMRSDLRECAEFAATLADAGSSLSMGGSA